MKNIEDAVTAQLCCMCHIDKAVENFIEFCSNKNDISHEKMKILPAEWKKQDEMKNKPVSSITLKETKNVGIASHSTILCQECNESSEIPIDTTIFKGKNYDGEPTQRPNSTWYRSNLEVVLATLASGMGASDASDFLSFLNLPKMASFKHQQFNKIENIIGKHLREVADQSMEKCWKKKLNQH